MATIKLDIVTAERSVYSDNVDMVIATGVEGELGILPHHAPLMTILQPGELKIKKGGEEILLVVSGGFLEVRPDHVVVLADAAERAEEIDVLRAQAAREKAREALTRKKAPGFDEAQWEVALLRAVARLRVANMVKRRKGGR
ncbi:MAG: F0F1 ATP synthase subunit epsilon [Chloroflexota bacterium]